MTSAVYLLIYGAAMAWWSPAPLARLTRRGLNPRLAVAAWMTAIVGVLGAWAAAISVLVDSGFSDVPSSSALVSCLELLGVPERALTPGPGSVAIIVLVVSSMTVAVSVKVGRSVTGSRLRSREHADAARMIGQPIGARAARRDVFVVSAIQPAAYCVVGRPNAIVVTTAAVRTLDEPQLAAVLAHEDAHIAGGHHHLLMVLRALAFGVPRLPLFNRAPNAVGQLLEMCADDSAARRHGTGPLMAGIVKLAGPHPHSSEGLSVAAVAILARLDRLAVPATGGMLWLDRLFVSITIITSAAAPLVVTALCHH